MPIDYQKSKIYKLWSPSKNLIYIGSTTETLAQRLAKHKNQHKRYNDDNTKTNYTTSFLVLDCEDYKLELLEEYPCNNRTQLEKKEGEYIKNNECINKYVAGRTTKEYRLDNADKIKERNKQYRLDNVDKIKEYRLDNADKNKEYNKQYYIDNADKLKEYRLDTVDKIKQYIKQYRFDNVDKIKEYNRQYYLKKKQATN